MKGKIEILPTCFNRFNQMTARLVVSLAVQTLEMRTTAQGSSAGPP
jgi:hypothetical protein